jgi:multidrug resistance efflux pump
MKSLAELERQLMDPAIYEIAIKEFRDLQAEFPYYKNHHSEAIIKGADAAGISFDLFQTEMTRRNSLKAFYNREAKRAMAEAEARRASAEAEKKKAEKEAFEKQIKKAELASRQMLLFVEPFRHID